MTPDLTIAICTRDRAERLGQLLAGIEAQAKDVRGSWELLVVDNGSSDATPEVAGRFAARLPLVLLSEPRVGLSAARNRALQAARAPLLAFTDDDVRLEEGWLAAWCGAAPRCGAYGWFGGRVVPSWPEGRPGWVVEERLGLLDGVFGFHEPADADRAYLPADPLPIGASFGLRTDLRASVGAFREDLGVRGALRGLGEETDWLLRARAAGHAGWHIHGALVHHPVERARLRLRALWRHGVASGEAHRRLHPDARSGSRLRALGCVARGARQWLLGRGDRFRQCVVNAGIEAGLRREGPTRARAAAQARQRGGDA